MNIHRSQVIEDARIEDDIKPAPDQVDAKVFGQYQRPILCRCITGRRSTSKLAAFITSQYQLVLALTVE